MQYRINTPIPITGSQPTSYLISKKHRGNPTRDISVWSIVFEAEIECFTSCYTNGWFFETQGWSFLLSDQGGLTTLGHNLRNNDLVIAKFTEDQNCWHGYPADIRNKPHDKPLPSILQVWRNAALITKTTMARIKMGQL